MGVYLQSWLFLWWKWFVEPLDFEGPYFLICAHLVGLFMCLLLFHPKSGKRIIPNLITFKLLVFCWSLDVFRAPTGVPTVMEWWYLDTNQLGDVPGVLRTHWCCVLMIEAVVNGAPSRHGRYKLLLVSLFGDLGTFQSIGYRRRIPSLTLHGFLQIMICSPVAPSAHINAMFMYVRVCNGISM